MENEYVVVGGPQMVLPLQHQQQQLLLSQHEYDYLVVIDFEATCDEGEQPKVTRENQEIIEFPWVVIDLVNQQVIDKRQIYVRPEWTSQLTPFCVKLTGITDDKLREAPLLHEAMAQVYARHLEFIFLMCLGPGTAHACAVVLL
jgi:3'-5' exoribonuclease 1